VAQMEALRRSQAGGEQRVAVQNADVGDGAEATMVGSPSQASGETPPDQSAGKVVHLVPMPGSERDGVLNPAPRPVAKNRGRPRRPDEYEL
jgi:hypothetical protein